jgi:selenocysteine lyase/cysteine desulfurase
MTTMVYLNNAATSWPKAPSVAAAMAEAASNLPGAANRGGLEDFDVLDAVRRRLARVMGVQDHDRIALGANATWGLNAAIFGLDLQAGDRVLATTAEHNSVLRPLFALSQDRGIVVEYLPTDGVGRVDPQAWADAMARLRPRLGVVTHASNVTGAANDIAALAALAHARGALLLLDMSQSLGWLDCALDAWGVDMAAFTGHKYLLGPQGTGGLYLRPGLELRPHLVGGTGIHSDRDTMPPQMPLHLEAGTNNEPGYHGLLAALDWAKGNPLERPRAATGELLSQLKSGLTALGARVIDPGAPSTPVLSFTLEGYAPDLVGAALAESYHILARTGLHCAPKIFSSLNVDPQHGSIRVSLSRFSTQADKDALLDALAEIVAAGPEWL